MWKSYNDFFNEVYVPFDECNIGEIKKWNESHEDELKLMLPQFLYPINDYDKSDLKVMIFGQEPLRWCNPEEEIYFYEDTDIQSASKLYSGYMNLLNDINKFKKSDIRKARFNQEYHRLQILITDKCKEYNKKAGFMWNNLIKLTPMESGNSGKKFFNQINAIRESSWLIKEEIIFFKPDILIFLTGPSYDFLIQNKIKVETDPNDINKFKEIHIFNVNKKTNVKQFLESQLCVYDIENTKLSLRTYHPQAHLKKEEWTKLHNEIDAIICNKISKLFS